MTEQSRRTFHEDLESVRDLIVQLGAESAEAVARATQTLLEGNLRGAQAVIDGNESILGAAFEIEESCQRLLALQQPMAIDLRRIMAATWIAAELVRVGGLAANICKGTRRIFGASLSPRIRGLIAEMNEESLRLTRLAVDAYVEEDAGLAAALEDIDDRLDSLHRSLVRTIIEEQGEGGLSIQPAVQLALIARYYERIGDHAVNIGERTCYLVSGWTLEQGPMAEDEQSDAAADSPDTQ